MARYSVVNRRRSSAQYQKPHPVWRGIGCLLILIVPLISWILAASTVQLAIAKGWPLPYQLFGYPVMPEFLWKLPVMVPLLFFIEHQQNLYLTLLLCLFYVIVGGGLISSLYALAYRLIGPPRYGPVDVPPLPIKVGRYKR